MAHEISVVNGVAEAMYANNPAWHGLGTVFDLNGESGPDGETARRLAHLDWSVALEPMQLQCGTAVDEFFATVRQDTKATLGVVKGRYKIHQNNEAFDFLDSLVQDGIMRYESAFALNGGKEVCLLARMPEVDEIAEGDSCFRYVAWMNSHDGTSAVTGLPTNVRVVCANTKAVALACGKNVKVSIRHTGNFGQKLEKARQYLSQFNDGFTLFRDKARLLATRQVTAANVDEYLETLFPMPEATETNQKTITRRNNKVAKVRAALVDPRQNIPSIKDSWWATYNAISQVVDHDSEYRGKPQDKAESRFESTMYGSGSAFKDEAFDLACEMAGV